MAIVELQRRRPRAPIAGKRQSKARELLASDGGNSDGEFVMIERRFLFAAGCIDQDVLRASLYGSPVPEVIGIGDPGDGSGNVDYQVASLGLYFSRSLIIRQGSLSAKRKTRGRQAEGGNQPSNGKSGKSMLQHGVVVIMAATGSDLGWDIQ